MNTYQDRILVPSSFIMQLGGIGGVEWIFIIIVVAVLFFGVKKIPEIARSFGMASAEFEKAKIKAKHELEQVQHQNSTSENAASEDRRNLESVAKVLAIDSTDKNNDELRVSIESEINNDRHRV